MAIVLFEGRDGTGKSTIAQEYAKRHNISYFKNPNEHYHVKNNETHLVTKYAGVFFAEFMKQVPIDAVIDRHYPSEWVYSHVLRRIIDESIINYIDKCFAEANAKIVICHHSCYRKDQHDIIEESNMMMIDEFYKSFSYWTKCSVLLLDTLDQDLERQIKNIDEFINGRKLYK